MVADRRTAPVPSRPRWTAVVALLVAALAGGLLLLTGPSATHDPAPSMLEVAPGGAVELASLAPGLQDLYRSAAADADAFHEVTCYCGCEEFLDHRHLLDCFVRPDGAWERHGSGCGVCIAEARDVLAMRQDDTPIADIVRAIDDRYASITDPAA